MRKLFLILFLFSSLAQAGFVKENGGNAVVCKNELGQQSVELLDFFEAVQAPDFFNFSKLKEKSKQQALDDAMALIKSVISEFSYAQYERNLKNFEAEAYFAKGITLGTVADSFHFIIPKNCTVEQTVVQIEPLFKEARYTINQDLWDLLAPTDQAGLIMHELIYRDLKSKDSRQVRLITAFLFSDQIQNMTREERIEVFKKLKFIDRYK